MKSEKAIAAALEPLIDAIAALEKRVEQLQLALEKRIERRGAPVNPPGETHHGDA